MIPSRYNGRVFFFGACSLFNRVRSLGSLPQHRIGGCQFPEISLDRGNDLHFEKNYTLTKKKYRK